jgi:outer membrane immunogenic protein
MDKKIVAALAVMFGVSGAAQAADLGGSFKDGPAPMAAHAPIWTGLYIGGSAGFGTGETSGQLQFDRFEEEYDVPKLAYRLDEGDSFGLGDFLETLFQSDYDVNGAIYGFHIGYNLQRDNIVFGVEAGLNGTAIDGSTDVLVLGKSERELDWYGTLVARLGYASGNMLFYGFGGVAWGTVETTVSVPAFGISGNGDSDHIGWTAGLGVEYAMSEHFSVRVEYSHVDLGEETAELDFGHGFTIDDKVDLSFDAIKIGASYRFGGREHSLEAMK